MHTLATVFALIAYPDIDPVAFSIGPLSVRWYGLSYVAGIMLAWLWTRRLVANPSLWPNNQPAMTALDLDDFIVWAAAGIILGGRLGYVLFYDLPTYLEEPLRIFEVWKGGMSFHGGLTGTVVAMILYAHKRGFSTLALYDVVGVAAPIGLFLVRIANFVNGELWGKLTSVPWAMVFPTGGPFPRHPSQLYEAALEGLVLFVLLAILTYRFKSFRIPGQTAGIFVVFYALFRIAVEFFREPDQQIGYLLGGWLTMGMVLSLVMALVGLALIAYAHRKAKLAA